MYCKVCGAKLGTYDTEKIEPPINSVVRKRDCLKCGIRYTTVEKIIEEEQLTADQIVALKVRKR